MRKAPANAAKSALFRIFAFVGDAGAQARGADPKQKKAEKTALPLGAVRNIYIVMLFLLFYLNH